MGMYLDIITEKVSKDAEKVAKSRVGFSGAFKIWKQLGNDMKALAKRPNVDPTTTGDYKSLQPWMMEMVKSAKDIDRLEYLQRDAYTGIYQLEKLEQNMKDVKAGHPSRFVDVKYINKIMASGNSPAKIRAYITWLRGTYLPAIKKKKADLKKAMNESIIKFV